MTDVFSDVKFAPKTDREFGEADGRRMLANGALKSDLIASAEMMVKYFPHDEYWKGILHVFNEE